MKTSIKLTLAGFIISLGSWLQAADNYYPVGCFHNDGDLNYTIVDVVSGKAVARVDNRLKRVPSGSVRFDRMELYADGYIEILKSELEPLERDARVVQVRESGEQIPNRTFLNFEFKSETDLDNCYAVIFSGSKSGIAAENLDELYVSFKALGKIKAGKTYEESFGVNIFFSATAEGDQNYFILFYDAGMPIRNSFDQEIAQHFSKRRADEFAFYLDQYVENNEEKSMKQSAFYTYVPYLPKALYAETGPIDSKVVLKISTTGAVTVESISNLENKAAKTFIEERISEWLFFPKLENGRPVSARIATKVTF